MVQIECMAVEWRVFCVFLHGLNRGRFFKGIQGVSERLVFYNPYLFQPNINQIARAIHQMKAKVGEFDNIKLFLS